MTAAYAFRQRDDYRTAVLKEAQSRAAGGGGVAVGSFVDFVSRVNPRYQWYPHVKQLAAVLQRVADGEIDRLMIFMPPRHGKSELVSRLFSAYYLLCHPERWVGINSYAAELAYTFSRNARDNYTKAGGQVKSDAAAVKHWETGRGGGLWAAGVGGPITGKGFHLGIIDDPIKNAEEAASETIRAKHRDWYDSTFYTREEPESQNTAIIVIQTRWHEGDLSGYLLDKEHDEPEGWHVVHFEAIKEPDMMLYPDTCTLEPDGRKEGEPLAPERYSLDKLKNISRRIGSYFFNALYQQRPSPKEGNQFRREWLSKFVDAVPNGCRRVRYWDTAGADEGKGDYTTGVLMARDPLGYYYVEDVVRGQWSAHKRNAIIRQTAELDRQRYNVIGHNEPDIYIEQPPGLAKESTEDIVRSLDGFSVYADRVTKDKIGRSEPYKAQCGAGNVYMVRGHWNRDYIDELCAFPYGANDDQVDGSSGAFNKLADYQSVSLGRNPLSGYRG
jgi:predicted phage terminase large subunit-like protein